MLKKIALLALASALLIATVTEAQTIVVTPPVRPSIVKPRRRLAENLPKFRPSLNISVGYGFPDLDKKYLPDFYAISRGNNSQSGFFIGSVNYQFSRKMSIGLMVAYGSVSAPYYDYYVSPSIPDFTARFETWSFMLNLVRYIPINCKCTPYIKTAIGFNSWKQEYVDANGNKVTEPAVDLPDLARQFALGVKFRLSERTGLFVEAGYGKYILHSGLSVKL